MRNAIGTIGLFLWFAAATAAENPPGTRYGVELNLDGFPQASPKECLGSVIKAIDGKQFDYLLAQLADPQFVDSRVKTLGGDFKELVRETKARLGDDPAAVKELRRLLNDGQVEEAGDNASIRLKDLKNRAVFVKKVKDR